MKGSYQFRVKSKKVVFEFTIRRNITVIKGESATGKTTLLHMLYEYLRVGRESGYSVTANANYYVYLRREVGRDWTDDLLSLENTVIFIEENNSFIFSREFADFVKTSGNYFVIVNRAPIKTLPYSIHEIYEIITLGRKMDVKESYHEFSELYSNYPVLQNNKMKQILVEDSNSECQFFEKIYQNCDVKSAKGNSNIIGELKKGVREDTLVIADGAAFGAMIEECLEFIESNQGHRITMWLPESFEYLILKAGIDKAERVNQILDSISDYVECSDYTSWEQYFTDLLMRVTEDTDHIYSKHKLNEYYLFGKNCEKIIQQMPEMIKWEMYRRPCFWQDSQRITGHCLQE